MRVNNWVVGVVAGIPSVARWYFMNCMPESDASSARFVRCSLADTCTDMVTVPKNPIASAAKRVMNSIANRAVVPRRPVLVVMVIRFMVVPRPPAFTSGARTHYSLRGRRDPARAVHEVPPAVDRDRDAGGRLDLVVRHEAGQQV